MMQAQKYNVILVIQHILLLEDLLMNSFGMLAFPSNFTILIIYFVQDICILLSAIALFLVFIETYLFQAGLIFLLIDKFKKTIFTILFYLCITVALHAWGLVCSWSNPLYYTEVPGYTALYALQRLTAVVYYYLYKRTSLRLSDPRYYADSQWIRDMFEQKQP
ncbi:hypothetical protein HELRODRAFT_88186 [Helobdella robusta]|uniref:Transmembrane protein 138 n=1 Tax=Helobdella robusta TaxID=6412 RepID=T1G6Z5_HELRO|nr:hypothetical protein HELRODRAFT_88186 [Helobdella robusta]ESN93779.1 hypothetical protein HELRODRAFT_88186 [Helobdella robusta]